MNTLTIKYIKGFFLLLTLLCIAFVGYIHFFRENLFIEQFKKQAVHSTGIDEGMQQTFSRTVKDYSSFIKQLASRSIFTVSFAQEPQDAGLDREQLSKIVDNLRLAGILSDEPKKAIIEDKKSQKTFYLKEGESFLEGIVVEEIKKDSVSLNVKNYEFELYL